MSRWRPFRDILLATSALAPLSLAPALANPQGGQVVGGAATIQSSGSTLTVNQTSDRAIINWQTFNIGSGEATRFVQPGASSIALNRVTGGLGPSTIDGSLTANGRVFVINADGIMIGRGAVIDTAGFLATTNDIRNVDFMGGRYVFSVPGRPDASVVNAGTITASNAGFAALVAPGVRNSGTITATFGKIGLASGNGFTLDFYGDKLITLNVSDSIAATVKDVSTGQALTSLVSNDGKLKANGGQVQLTAVAARKIVDSVINNTGVIEARSIGHRNGKIVLGGPTATTKVAGAPTQTVKVSGKLDVSGKKKGTTGGTIQVTAENIVLASATLDASGNAGGGKVLIGGDVGGGNPNPLVASIAQAKLEAEAIPNATSVSVDSATTINASAVSSGNGGKVVVWSDSNTSFAGAITATGGALSGNGGFVEVSGHDTLAFTGGVDTTAANGTYGTLLLDPGNVTIGSGTTSASGSQNFVGNNSTDSFILPSKLEAALHNGSVIIATTTGGSADGGNIIVASSFSWGGGTSDGSSLTLSAFHNVIVNDRVTITNIGSGNLTLRADSLGRGSGTVIFNGTGHIDFSHTPTSAQIEIIYNSSNYATPTDYSPAVTVGAASQLTAYMLVNTVANLQSIGTNLAGNYALGRDIDLSSVVNFVPLGTFEGQFDGRNRTIGNLTIAPTSPSVVKIGLFSTIDAGAGVRNLNLSNVSVTANPSLSGVMPQEVGTLAGVNAGVIRNVTVTGSFNGGSVVGVIAGGLVGQNGNSDGTTATAGTIFRSSANVLMHTGDGSNCIDSCTVGFNLVGGLVGFNAGTISQSSASGDIFVGANSAAGGLVGVNHVFTAASNVVRPFIGESFATGNVTATGVNAQIGGLVGYSGGALGDLAGSGIISNSRATGAVTANAKVDNSGCNGGLGVCYFIDAGGLVGFNQGVIIGTDAPSVDPNPALGSGTYATGAVSVGSNGLGGGLVGLNDGLILGALATGRVTGAVGTADAGTVLGGLVGMNQGVVAVGIATGDVGGAGIAYLQAGGLAGGNNGVILLGLANGNVTAGDNSMAGGLAGSSGPGNGTCSPCDPGLAFNNSGRILLSAARGDVTVGASSFAGGLVGTGGLIGLTIATGAVTGGGNSSLGGLVGALGLDDRVRLSAATGAVTSTGSGSVVGGLVGANGGTIEQSIALGAVTGTSSSYLGGLAGVNIGSIVDRVSISDSRALVNVSGVNNVASGFVGIGLDSIVDLVSITSSHGAVTGTGASNVAGGLVGFNAGTINGALSSSDVTSGANSIVGGLVGANTGIVTNSLATGIATAGPGSTVGAQIGIDGPTTASNLPPFPPIITTCDDAVCAAFLAASTLPEPTTTPSTPTDVPDDVLAPPVIIATLGPPVDHLVQQGLGVLIALLQPPNVQNPAIGGGGGPGKLGTGPGANGGQPFAPPMVVRPIAGPGGERFSSIPPLKETRFFTDQVLLQVPANVSPDEVARVARELGLSVMSTQNLSSTGRIAFQFRLANGRTVRDVIRALEANRITAIAQPNYQFTLMQPAGGEQQSDNPQYAVDKLRLTEAHRTVSGRGVTIAVIDSEVDQSHTELKGAISEELNVLDANVKAHPHGTAMVGAIASRDRLTGVAPGAKIIAVRAFGETTTSAEGTTYNILKGIEWAVSQGARVINMSFAGPYDPSLARALKAAADKGVVLISAAGNAGPKSPALFPGADPNVIAVTATDSSDKLFRMANQGGYVSVASPGVEVLAPAPEEAYQMSTGTSIATAHVSGVVALMLERDPALTPADIRKILESTATDLGPKGKDNQFGWGLINPQKALAAVDARKQAATPAKP